MNKNDMITMATGFERLCHWSLAISCILLIISGFGFLFKIEAIGAAFGGFNSMKTIHNWLGVVFIAALFLSAAHWLKHALRFDGDDVRWLSVGGGYLSHKVKVPPMGKLNTGQKFAYLMVLTAGIAISVTGFVMWLIPENKQWVLLSFFIHNVSFIMIGIFIPLHLYLGTIANPGTLQIMIGGKVPYWMAKKKHPKWIAELESGKGGHSA
ncbi:MAG: formate dehydrogenase gamma subunit [Nitrospirae bacterium]|nr:MAG: formate dehydrogenase gamma subunit [Nitrospirota bacterium]